MACKLGAILNILTSVRTIEKWDLIVPQKMISMLSFNTGRLQPKRLYSCKAPFPSPQK